MRIGKRTVKWLYAEFSRILLESPLIHQRDRSQAPDVGVVQSSTVVEVETHRGVVELCPVKVSVVDQKGAREPRLDDDAVAGVEVQHHQLCPSPAAKDGCIAQTLCQRARGHLAKHVRFFHGHLFYSPTADRAVEVARDCLRLR